MNKEIFQNRVSVLPAFGKPNHIYYVPNGQGTDVDEYIADKNGAFRKVNPIVSLTASIPEITRETGENIASGLAVIIWTNNKIYKYDITNPNHIGLTCGVSKTSATTGNDIVVVLVGGVLTDVGSGWNSGLSYYISATSTLTTTAPTTGVIKKIATGINVDTIIINDYIEFETI